VARDAVALGGRAAEAFTKRYHAAGHRYLAEVDPRCSRDGGERGPALRGGTVWTGNLRVSRRGGREAGVSQGVRMPGMVGRA
jgi:hypothetical protein